MQADGFQVCTGDASNQIKHPQPVFGTDFLDTLQVFIDVALKLGQLVILIAGSGYSQTAG